MQKENNRMLPPSFFDSYPNIDTNSLSLQYLTGLVDPLTKLELLRKSNASARILLAVPWKSKKLFSPFPKSSRLKRSIKNLIEERGENPRLDLIPGTNISAYWVYYALTQNPPPPKLKLAEWENYDEGQLVLSAFTAANLQTFMLQEHIILIGMPSTQKG